MAIRDRSVQFFLPLLAGEGAEGGWGKVAMNPQQLDLDSNARRAAVRRTAWTVGLIAIVIYVAFLLSGVIGR